MYFFIPFSPSPLLLPWYVYPFSVHVHVHVYMYVYVQIYIYICLCKSPARYLHSD